MSPETIDILKIFFSFAGAAAGGIGAFSLKEVLDRRRLRTRELQTRWLPLLSAAEDFEGRLRLLTQTYANVRPENRWKDRICTDSGGVDRSLPLAAKDFHELYLVDSDPPLLRNFWDVRAPGLNRQNSEAVQRVRERIHELNSATIALYRTAVYLALAQRVLQELRLGQLTLARTNSNHLIGLLQAVRTKLNGNNGEGIIDDLQDLIGESVWNPDETIISYYEFRERLLSSRGWEQFTDLFRFYVHFHWKVETEVKHTAEALAQLRDALQRHAQPHPKNTN